jgi:phosphinothricin acetyltransferase
MPRPSPFAFRTAERADLPAIVAIYNATVPSRMVTADLEPVSVESRVPWFEEHASPRHPLLVATEPNDAQRVLGWISLQAFNPRCAYQGTLELSVYVEEAHRRRGVGRSLIEHVCERAPELGVDTLVGLVFGHNAPSLSLFESLGFERWGLMPGVARLDGVRRDLVFVGRHL